MTFSFQLTEQRAPPCSAPRQRADPHPLGWARWAVRLLRAALASVMDGLTDSTVCPPVSRVRYMRIRHSGQVLLPSRISLFKAPASLQPQSWIPALLNWLMSEKEALNFEHARSCLCRFELLIEYKWCLNINVRFSMHVPKWMITSLSAETWHQRLNQPGGFAGKGTPINPCLFPQKPQVFVDL